MSEGILEAVNVLCKSQGKRMTASLQFSEWDLAAGVTVTAELPHSDVPNLFVLFVTCWALLCSYPSVWITQPLLWAQTLTATVCLIRLNFHWWYSAGSKVSAGTESENITSDNMDGFKNHHNAPTTVHHFTLSFSAVPTLSRACQILG